MGNQLQGLAGVERIISIARDRQGCLAFRLAAAPIGCRSGC
jgi:hypothetical protein